MSWRFYALADNPRLGLIRPPLGGVIIAEYLTPEQARELAKRNQRKGAA